VATPPPGIHSAAQIAGWKRVTEAVHDRGGRIFLQLWIADGCRILPCCPWRIAVAPSAIQPEGNAFTMQVWYRS